MKARKKGQPLPVYPQWAVDKALDALPDPDTFDKSAMVFPYLTDDGRRGDMEFRLVTTVDRHPSEGATYWRWELVGRVEEMRP